MHKKRYTIPLIITGLLLGLIVRAQDSMPTKKIEMASGMRANGKIYVVITVLIIILLGLIAYVVALDRKIRKFEKGDRS
jgi:hypothetical protein